MKFKTTSWKEGQLRWLGRKEKCYFAEINAVPNMLEKWFTKTQVFHICAISLPYETLYFDYTTGKELDLNKGCAASKAARYFDYCIKHLKYKRECRINLARIRQAEIFLEEGK